MRHLVAPPLVLALVVSLVGPALAAAAPGKPPVPVGIAGVVVDESGAVVPGAAVTLRVPGRSPEETFSDSEGRFSFGRVLSGPVILSVSMPGFSTATLDLPSPRPMLRVVLQPGAVTEHITVRPDAPSQLERSAGTKTATPLRDVPQAITVIPQQAITDQAMQSMADIVRHVPGIGAAQGEGNRDAVVFRGNSSTGDFFVDGVRDDVQYYRDVYNVERVEALKGPNAMMFGRGGAGGVINRITRQANFSPVREFSAQAGSFADRRLALDVGQQLSRKAAARFTGMYEISDSYRRGVGLERYGINPTLALVLGANTTLAAGYERFRDDRTADRGVPSWQGRPLATDASTFFGDADRSRSRVTVNAATASLERRAGATLVLRSLTRLADYDKFYQNVFPGAVNATGTGVTISGYNHGTLRRNVFNQTDATWSLRTGRVRHTLLAGFEIGRQSTSNTRSTAYFTSGGRSVTAVTVPVDNPTVALPVGFAPSATDADNDSVATSAAIYLQDQVQLTSRLQAIVGVRYDDFRVKVHDNRQHSDLRSRDHLLAPRAGLVFKPAAPLSLYASYSLAYQPRAGEQLSSLSLSNQALEPERFTNYEVGAKWDVRRALWLSAALYRLDRTNVAVADPTNPAVLLLVDGQRARGVELGLSGRVTTAWSVMAAYAYQDGEILRSLSATAKAGARLAQLPAHSLSIWSRYDVSQRIGAGLGIIRRGEIFASTDNAVVVPAFTRVDAAVFVPLNGHLRCQVNVENVLNRRYYATAHSNNNITPASPRAVRVGVTASF